MVDTIRLYCPSFNSYHKGFIDLEKFNTHKTTKDDLIYFNTFYDDNGKASINIKYDAKRDYLVLTFSIPKIIYGNSLSEFSFIENEKVLLIERLKKRLEGIIEIDFLTMRVSRIDIATNIKTRFNIKAYLRALEYCTEVSKKYKVQSFRGSSLIISNNSKRISFYDKESEQLKLKELDRSYKRTGKVLRFEVQLKNTNTIRKELKLGEGVYLTFYDVLNCPEIFSNYLFGLFKKITKDYVLNSELNEFQSDLGMIEVLSKHFKRNILPYFLILKYVKDFDIKNYEALLNYIGVSDKAVYYLGKKLKKIEAMSLDNRHFDLVREIANEIEKCVCKF